MTEYLKDKFTVPLGSDNYRDNWDRIFGKKEEAAPDTEREVIHMTDVDIWPTVETVYFARISNRDHVIGSVCAAESDDADSDMLISKHGLLQMLREAYRLGKESK